MLRAECIYFEILSVVIFIRLFNFFNRLIFIIMFVKEIIINYNMFYFKYIIKKLKINVNKRLKSFIYKIDIKRQIFIQLYNISIENMYFMLAKSRDYTFIKHCNTQVLRKQTVNLIGLLY